MCFDGQQGRSACNTSISLVVVQSRSMYLRHDELDRLTGNYFVGRVGKFNQYLVRAWYQSNKNNGFSTGVDKVPRSVVDGDVDMTDARRYCKCSLAKDWHHPQVLRPVLNEDTPRCSGFGEWWIDNQFGRGFVFNGDQRRWATNIPGALSGCLRGEDGADGDGGHKQDRCVHQITSG